MNESPAIVWFRYDLRLADNPAVQKAIARGGPVIALFIWSPEEEVEWQPGGASRWWLHQSLARLSASLEKIGARLVIRRGASGTALKSLLKETGADAVFWNRRYEPALIERDRELKAELRSTGCTVETFNSALLFEPWTVQNKSGKPFQVFTPYWKTCLALGEPADPLPSPRFLPSPKKHPASVPLATLELEPKTDWASGIRSAWIPGESAAKKMLEEFCDSAFANYGEGRNRPDQNGTSRLSPYLHFGEISPRQVWHGLRRAAEKAGAATATWRNSQFLAEIGWREFAHHLLFHFPEMPMKPLRTEFENFPWRDDADFLKAWQRGQTGYPLVDAGMRQLWTTGWMHNRVRMVVGSFLVKDLLLPWQEGARWFWDTLVDADLANNTLGWQWIAGCGADAAPFFRIFNPTTQGEKFDPQGDYVRRWVPELGRLPAEWIHQPSNAPADILARAGVQLGRNYPPPIISHTIAREVALAAYAKIRKKS